MRKINVQGGSPCPQHHTAQKTRIQVFVTSYTHGFSPHCGAAARPSHLSQDLSPHCLGHLPPAFQPVWVCSVHSVLMKSTHSARKLRASATWATCRADPSGRLTLPQKRQQPQEENVCPQPHARILQVPRASGEPFLRMDHQLSLFLLLCSCCLIVCLS